MSRSSWKGPYVHPSILKKMRNFTTNPDLKRRTVIKTWSRSTTVVPSMVGITFDVHNGKSFVRVQITQEKIGHRLGEFVPTRKFVSHSGKKAKPMAT